MMPKLARATRLLTLAAIAALALAASGKAEAATNLLQNPSLETATDGSVPDCWQLGGYGANRFTWTRTLDAHSGSYAEELRVKRLSSGDRKLVSEQVGDGACWPAAAPGHRYTVSAWYKGNAPTLFAYYWTSAGGWAFWTQSPRFPDSGGWDQATWTTPAVPSGAEYLSVGLGLEVTGSLFMDDFSLVDADAGLPVLPPPPPAPPPPPGPPPPPPPAGGTSFRWGFDAPNCLGNLWGTSSWLSPVCSAPDWYTEGIYYSVPDLDKPTNVLTQDASGVDSTGTWQAWVHNPVTVNGSWGTEHQVDVDVKLVRWGSQAKSICSWAGGPKIFMGRQADKYETSTYTIELAICDGSAHIQKKEWGNNMCGIDPRAVDCGAGGTWYLLAQAHPGVPSFGVWHRFTGIKRDNPDGSVTLIGIRDGVEILRYTEVPHDLPYGPLRGGRDGWRSNAIDWHMDSYTVTVR